MGFEAVKAVERAEVEQAGVVVFAQIQGVSPQMLLQLGMGVMHQLQFGRATAILSDVLLYCL